MNQRIAGSFVLVRQAEARFGNDDDDGGGQFATGGWLAARLLSYV